MKTVTLAVLATMALGFLPAAQAQDRDPNADSDGARPGPMKGMDMLDDAWLTHVLTDKLEFVHGKDGDSQRLQTDAWFGGDTNKLWLKLEGERAHGKVENARVEALWDRAIAPYWSLQAGARRDFGEGPERNWGAIGIEGLAPYWFDVEATAYVGPGGRTAARVEARYDLLITQRLILQPDLEMAAYGKSDPARGIGAGLSSLDAGLRLRYEVRRQFAPYIGVNYNRKFGTTADLARAAGNSFHQVQFLAGVRAWF